MEDIDSGLEEWEDYDGDITVPLDASGSSRPAKDVPKWRQSRLSSIFSRPSADKRAGGERSNGRAHGRSKTVISDDDDNASDSNDEREYGKDAEEPNDKDWEEKDGMKKPLRHKERPSKTSKPKISLKSSCKYVQYD